MTLHLQTTVEEYVAIRMAELQRDREEQPPFEDDCDYGDYGQWDSENEARLADGEDRAWLHAEYWELKYKSLANARGSATHE